MQKNIAFAIKILIGTTFFIPLIVLSQSFIFPFIVPKILALRTITLLMFAGYVLLLLSDWKTSTFAGVDWYRSFWDNHERMLGLFTMVHYVLYFMVVATVVRSKETWRSLIRTFLIAGGLVMFLGFWQRFVNPEALVNRGALRVSATLGNAIYFSGYGLFLFFLGLYSALREKGGWRYLAGVVSFLGFLGIFLGGTRGTLLGLIAGLGMLSVFYIVSLRKDEAHKAIRYGFIGLIAAVIALVGVLFVFRETEFVKSIPAVGRLVRLDVTSGSAGTRVMAWGIAVDAWRDKPLFGWGPNNYYYAFNSYYDASFLRGGWGETWFDNAHSAFFNTLAVQGIVGSIAYLFFFAAPGYMLFQARRRGDIDMHTANIMGAFLIGHFVHNVFVFENPTSYLYFFFILAYIHARTVKQSEHEVSIKNISGGMIGVVSVVTLIIIFATNVNPAKANMGALDVIKAVNSGSDGVGVYERISVIPTPHINDIRNDVARSMTELIPKYVELKRVDEAQAFYTLALTELDKNVALHPLDIRVKLQQVQTLQQGYRMTNDEALLEQQKTILEEALALSPERQQIRFQLASLNLQMKNIPEAVEHISQTIEDDPEIDEGWWRLALLYKSIGEQEKAEELIMEAIRLNVKIKKSGRAAVKDIFGPDRDPLAQ